MHSKSSSDGNDQSFGVGSSVSPRQSEYERRYHQFARLLSMPVVDIDSLKGIAWSGVPRCFRARVYRLFLDYEPIDSSQAAQSLSHKRLDYLGCMERMFSAPQRALWTNAQRQALRQIQIDIPRTSHALLHDARVQAVFEHVLFIWAVRHPASSYVQGMNDILVPFFVLFLSEHFPDITLDSVLRLECVSPVSDSSMLEIEADCFWCFSAMLDGIQDTFTKGQPGIFRMIAQLQTVVRSVDPALDSWIAHENINYLTFMFKWVNCMFVREFPVAQLLRVWDVMLSDYTRITLSQVYICAAMLTALSPQLVNRPAAEFIIRVQEVPPAFWDEARTSELIAQAFVYERLFPQLHC